MTMRWFLGGVMALFVGILLALIVIARHANPILLDSHGRPVTEASGSHHR